MWVRDKLEAEQHALSFARRHPQMTVTVLRLAPLLGPGLYTFYTRLFARRMVSVACPSPSPASSLNKHRCGWSPDSERRSRP
jgi:nucleoside-diphosphate-sugar epimerase